MKENLKKYRESIFVLFILFILFLPFIMGREYIIGYDIKSEYLTYYTSFRNSILSGNFPLWQFNMFLGNNLLASKSYYFLGDIFAYVPILLFWVDMERCLLIIQIIKMFLAFHFFKCLCKKLNFKANTQFLCSVIYMLSSWVLVFIGQPMFQTTYCLFPLLLIGIENYLQQKKVGLVLVASFLLVAANFYYFWSISVFLLLYWPIRYFWNKKEKFSIFVKDTMGLIFFYGLGAMLYSAVLFPTVHFLLESPRVESNYGNLFVYSHWQTYLNMLKNSLTSPFYLNTEIPNYYTAGYYRFDQIAIYSSFLTMLLLPQLFVIYDKKKKILISIVTLVLTGVLLLPFGGSMMHGFAEPSFRWVFLLATIQILSLGLVLNHLDQINRKLLCVTSIGIVTVLIGMMMSNDFMSYKRVTIGLLMTVCFTLIATIALMTKSKYKMVILNSLVLFELFGIFTTTLQVIPNRFEDSYTYMEENFLTSQNRETLIRSDDFYRVNIQQFYTDIDYGQVFNNNIGIYFGFNTVHGYDSTYIPSIDSFLKLNGQNYWWFHINNYNAQKLLSTKYQIVLFENELPHENFKFISNFGNTEFKIYEDCEALPFGFTYTQVILNDKFYESYQEAQLKMMLDTLVVDEDSVELSGTRNTMKNIQVSNNSLSGTISTDGRQWLFFSIPYDKGWEIIVDGNPVKVARVNTSFMGVLLEEGEHTIQMKFFPYGMKLGMVVSMITFILIIGSKRMWDKRVR